MVEIEESKEIQISKYQQKVRPHTHAPSTEPKPKRINRSINQLIIQLKSPAHRSSMLVIPLDRQKKIVSKV